MVSGGGVGWREGCAVTGTKGPMFCLSNHQFSLRETEMFGDMISILCFREGHSTDPVCL